MVRGVQMNHFLIGLLVLHALMLSVYEGIQFYSGYEAANHVKNFYVHIFYIIVVVWIDHDSRRYPQISKCFDFRYLIFLFSPIYAPYYLYRTRGFVLGTLYYCSMLFLFWLSYFVKMTIFCFS